MANSLDRRDPTGLGRYTTLRAEHGPTKARALWARHYQTACPFDYHADMITLDLETCSAIDLADAGVYVYARDASTRVLVVGFALGDLEAVCVAPDAGCPEQLSRGIREGLPVVAHNAEFEIELWNEILVRRHGWPPIPFHQWRCSMAACARLALPLSLGGACEVLELSERKSDTGRALMLKLCKPAAPIRGSNDPWRHHTDDNLAKLADYCRQDVRAEHELWQRTQSLMPWTGIELAVWRETLALNARGLAVDVAAVDLCRRARAVSIAEWGLRCVEVTAGQINADHLTNVSELKAWFASRGAARDELTKATLAELVQHADPAVRMVAKAREAVGMASLAKLDTITAMAAADGRVHGSLVYHGCSTGRWAGRGVQVQNLPRAAVDDVDACLADLDALDPETFAALWGDACGAIQGCLRGLFVAGPGKTLVAADYAQIEARVLLWLAMDPGLELFRAGADIYKEMAATIYGVSVSQVTKAQRQLGKMAILGLGFGMGVQKFYSSCQNAGIHIDPDMAKQVVEAYRLRFAKVKSYWYQVEDAARDAVREPGTPIVVRARVAFKRVGDHLFARLPSRRLICYPFAELKPGVTPWGESRDSVAFKGVSQTTRQWETQDTYGGKLVENLVQATARDVMAEALLRAVAAGYSPVLSVHDELVCEVDEGGPLADCAAFGRLCAELPAWADGLPVVAEAWDSPARRYHK